MAIDNSGETLKGLSSSVNEVTDFVSQIVIAFKEQSLASSRCIPPCCRWTKSRKVTQVKLQTGFRGDTLIGASLELRGMLTRFTLDGASKLENSPN